MSELRSGLGRAWRGFSRGALGLFLSSCSLQTFDQQDCSSHQECRAAFGLGSTCSMDGFCSSAQRHPRCTRTYPEDLFEHPGTATNTDLIFGTLFNQENETHRAREKAVLLAISQVNDAGGLEGQRFGLVLCDIAPKVGDSAESTAAGAVAAGRYLSETLGLAVLLGPSASSDVGTVYAQLRNTGVLLISPSATSPALTALDGGNPTDESPGRLWRTAPPDSLQGMVIAEDMTRRDVQHVAVIAKRDEYGEGLSSIFLEHTSANATLLFFRSAGELSEVTTQVGNSDVQEVLFIASAQDDVAGFLNAAGALDGYADKNIFLTDSAATQNTLGSGADELFPRIRGTRPNQASNQDPVYGTFIAGYLAAYREDVTTYSFTAHSYDMTWLAMLGTAWAVLQEDQVEGLTIARGIRKLSSGDEFSVTPSNWRGVVQRFREGDGVNLHGASGTLDFDPQTEETTGPIDVWTIADNPLRFEVSAVHEG